MVLFLEKKKKRELIFILKIVGSGVKKKAIGERPIFCFLCVKVKTSQFPPGKFEFKFQLVHGFIHLYYIRSFNGPFSF